MQRHVEPVAESSWIKGDYRHGAWIAGEPTAIESLAQTAGATLHHFVEEGLGPGRSFRLRLSTGRQVAFEQYEQGVQGVSLLVLFENEACSKSEIWWVLGLLGVAPSKVSWVAPEAK